MQLDLTSDEDTYLYLLRGADSGGTVDRAENDDVVNACNTNSRITETLAAGTYTIEATTYDEGVTGEFSLSIVPRRRSPTASYRLRVYPDLLRPRRVAAAVSAASGPAAAIRSTGAAVTPATIPSP